MRCRSRPCSGARRWPRQSSSVSYQYISGPVFMRKTPSAGRKSLVRSWRSIPSRQRRRYHKQKQRPQPREGPEALELPGAVPGGGGPRGGGKVRKPKNARVHLTGWDRNGQRVNRHYVSLERAQERARRMDWVNMHHLGVYVLPADGTLGPFIVRLKT